MVFIYIFVINDVEKGIEKNEGMVGDPNALYARAIQG